MLKFSSTGDIDPDCNKFFHTSKAKAVEMAAVSADCALTVKSAAEKAVKVTGAVSDSKAAQMELYSSAD